MSFKLSKRQIYSKSLALLLGLGLTISLLTGLALAREGEPGLVDPDSVQPLELAAQSDGLQIYWLILDSAESVDDVLPQLQALLTTLRLEGTIVAFDDQPQASAPNAVSGLEVVALPDALETLQRLPGVLAVTTELPPPPPDSGELGALAATGTVTGQITNAANGQPLQSPLVIVNIYDAVSFDLLTNVPVNTNGIYQATVTAPYNQVKVRAKSGPGDIIGFVSEWYDDVAFFSEATPIDLSGGGTQANNNIVLTPGGRISGTLTFAGGGPATGVSVKLYRADNQLKVQDTTVSDGTGNFEFAGLGTGAYKLQFSGGGALAEWFQDQTNFDDAQPVPATPGQTAKIQAELSQGGSITGTLLFTPGDQPALGVDVTVVDSSGKIVGVDISKPPNGQYQVGGLETGGYKVLFAAAPTTTLPLPSPLGDLSYVREFYNDQTSLASATSVNVTAGTVAPNINATLALTGPGFIIGTLSSDGTPLSTGQTGNVFVHDPDIEGLLEKVFTLEGDGIQPGYATDPVIKGGGYKVRFLVTTTGGNSRSEFFDDKTDFSTADLVTVIPGQPTTDVSGDLTFGVGASTGGISGTLTSNGNPVIGAVKVYAYKTDEASFSSRDTFVAGNGVYAITDLEPGNYLVSFSQFPSATTWYNGQGSRANATQVAVTAGNVTPNIDGTLDDLGACISGKIINQNGNGVPSSIFAVFDSGDNSIYFWEGLFGTSFVLNGNVDDDGGYVACGLAAGTYTIRVVGGQGVGESDPVTVSGGGTQNVDVTVTLPSGETIVYLPVVLKN